MAAHADRASAQKHYIKIWGILLVLLVISVLGPELRIQWLTLVTAFGIAVVKAYLVAKNFMHVNLERRWVTYLLVTMVAVMFLFFYGTAPDVMKHTGHNNWENISAKASIERGMKEYAKHKAEAAEGKTHDAPAGAEGHPQQ
jgi:caa(3)-type oxidase subunit IV